MHSLLLLESCDICIIIHSTISILLLFLKFLLQIVCPLQALEFYHQQQTFHFKVFSSENPSEALEKKVLFL